MGSGTNFEVLDDIVRGHRPYVSSEAEPCCCPPLLAKAMGKVEVGLFPTCGDSDAVGICD